jgi:ribosomal protein S18 acetylase RimI-like enzyme
MLATSSALAADPWLAGLLQRPAFRLADNVQVDAATEARLAAEPLFVTAKPRAADVETIGRLVDAGFRVVDFALTFDACTVSNAAKNKVGAIQFACASDRIEVAALAARAFRFSRFHLDPVMPNAIANRIKAAWAANFFDGARGDAMVVAEEKGRIAGFLQLLRPQPDVFVIDLIAVAPECARRGIASAMINFAWRNGIGDGTRPSSLRVGTQAANIGSCRLYEGLGFRLCASSVVLHHHGAGGCYPDAAS